MADGDGVHAAFSVFVYKLCSVLRFAVGGAPDQILIEKCECENKICSSWETDSDRSRVKTILTQSLGIDI